MLLLGQFTSSSSYSFEHLEATLVQALSKEVKADEEDEVAIKLTLLLLLIVQDIPFHLLNTTPRLFSMLVEFTKASFTKR